MNEQVQKVYEYVSKMEEMHLNRLTGGENISADMINNAAMCAYGMTRWFIEDMINNSQENHNSKETEVNKSDRA